MQGVLFGQVVRHDFKHTVKERAGKHVREILTDFVDADPLAAEQFDKTESIFCLYVHHSVDIKLVAGAVTFCRR